MTVMVTEMLVCVSCGAEFPPSLVGGRPRRHCHDCRAPRTKQPPPPVRRKTAGQPFTLPHFRAWAHRLKLDSGKPWALDPFQEAFVADLFSGIPECWLIVPEGNGKSTLVGGLALYHIEHRDDARVPVAASSREQAGIIYRQAEGFVRRGQLQHVFRCLRGHRRIECLLTGSAMQLHAADAGTADGEIFTLGLIDELHRHKSLELYRIWNGKTDKREGAQLVVISTAGEPGGEFEAERELLRQTAENTERGETFTRSMSSTSVMHEWAVPEGGDVEDLELVARANPASIVTVERLREKRKRTRHLGHWKRFTCNLAARGAEAAITELAWFAALTDERIPEGAHIGLGLDIGWIYDTTALVPLWVRDPEFRLLGEATILEPPGDGTMLDPNEIKRALLAIHARNPIHTVAMDTSDGVDLAQWIADEIGCEVIDRAQTNSMFVMDYDRFTEALRERWLWHTGGPGLTRHVLNAVAQMLPGGDVRFQRPKKNRRSSYQDMRVIDALSAACFIHTTMAAELSAPATSEPFFAFA
ncbi:MAG: terminase large subunit [Gemmatimonadaceae bacterium]|nr:terminase large subunit [Gemmatimonadaceae bacterium]